MSVSAIIMLFYPLQSLWGGFAYCLRIALKTNA